MKTRRNGVEPGPSSPRRGQQTETSNEAQLARVLQALEENASQTTDDLRALGIYQVSARVFSLRQHGHEIVTELFNGYSADGYHHKRMARYTLIGFNLPARSRDGQSAHPQKDA